MAWRITYWRGATALRVTTIEDATKEEVASSLCRLAADQLDLECLRTSEDDTPESPEIRSNRSGTMLWTTGRDFHYTAELFSDGGGGKRKRAR
jgi:hypothetical protein